MNSRDKRRVFIGTLGACAVWVDGKVVSGVPSNFYRLAAYLLLSSKNGSASRQRIWSMFWPHPADADRASANLRRSLARIRAVQKQHGFSLIESNFGAVYLVDDPDVQWDLRALVERLSEEKKNIKLGSYPGDLLVDLDDGGPEFEDWLSQHREALRRRFLDRLTVTMSDRSWASESRAARRALAQDVLAVDPCNEEAYRILMLDAASSRNAGRLEQVYQRCEAELKREFGVATSSETRALYEGLMRSLIGQAPAPQP